jgi:subfamily B ATP-binding cassette protein MsbA
MKTFLRVLKYIKSYRGYTFLNIFFNVLVVVFSLVSFVMLIPFLSLLFGRTKLVSSPPSFSLDYDTIINYLNYIISHIIESRGKVDALIFICLFLIITFFSRNFFRFLAIYFLANIRNGIVKDIRNQVYYKILILPISYYTEKRKGDVISRVTTDVQEVEWSILSYFEMIIRDPITIIAYFVALAVMSPKLTLFVFAILPVTGIIIGRIGRSLRKTSIKGQIKIAEILSVIEESISGIRIIKAFNTINFFNNRFSKLNDSYTRLMIGLYRRRDLSSPLSEFLSSLVIIIVLWFGGRLVLSSSSSISAEVFITYIVIFSQIIPPAKTFAAGFYSIQKGLASADRIFQVIDAEEVIEEKPNALPIKKFKKCIEYKNIFFKYEKETVLDNINIKIPKGKIIAIVGESGGGKSTLVDLLPRFYDPGAGKILIDEVPIKDYKIDDLRGLMGIVTQESILFNDTIFNNIAFGNPDIDEKEVIEAAKIANAHDFIMKTKNGYQTNIGDRGDKLSGGQKQRISIARAILKNPPILILDEATSSLDTESERLVQDALLKLMKNRTSVVIAHRLSTIQFSDEIIVLQKGKLVERGTHSELLTLNGVYKKLVDLQSFS